MINSQVHKPQAQKPSTDEWLHWAHIVIARLTTCVHTYSKPLMADIFMAERERQEKNAIALDLLRRIHHLADEAEVPSDNVADVHLHDEKTIDGLGLLFAEALEKLPQISIDMQKLLKSPWFDNCNGRLASELFRGPMGNLPEGIGSGHPEHGRLPEVLASLIDREQMGDVRQPREHLLRHAEPRRQEDDARKRWAENNSRHLRSAGRVE